MKFIYSFFLLFIVFNLYSQEDNTVYDTMGLDSSPEPFNSMDAFKEFIISKIPCMEVDEIADFSFVVEKNGSLSSLKFNKSNFKNSSEECNEKIINAFNTATKWAPGKLSGKNVRVYYNLSIKKKADNISPDSNSKINQKELSNKENENNDLILMLDGLKSTDFVHFPIIDQVNTDKTDYYDYELWNGELFLKGSTIFNPRLPTFAFGYSVYDILKKQYGRIVYSVDTSCFIYTDYRGLIPTNNDGSYFYSYCNSDVYKTYLIKEDYSTYKYYDEKQQISRDEVKGINYQEEPFFKFSNEKSLEFERNNKIYTFYKSNNSVSSHKSNFINFNKNNNYATCTKVVGEHDKMTYLLVSTYKNSEQFSKKIININNLINDIDSPLLVNKSVNQITSCKREYLWIIDNIYIFNDDKVLITIYSRDNNNPGFKGGLPINLGRDYKIAILLDNKLEYLNSGKIISGDETKISENSNYFYQIIKDGAKVICYDKNIEVKWYKQFGYEDNKNVGKISYIKEFNNYLYLMGTHSNKYHIGYPDPIVWKISSINGNLIQEDIVKEKSNVQGPIEGFLFTKNNLFLVLPSSIINSYNVKKSSTILKKTNISLD